MKKREILMISVLSIITIIMMIFMHRGKVNKQNKLQMLENELESQQVEQYIEGTWEEESKIISIKKEKKIGTEYNVNNIDITENGKSIKIACNIINLNRYDKEDFSIKIIFKNISGEIISSANIKIAGMSSSENRYINIVIPTFEKVKETADIEFEKIEETTTTTEL